jgi:hypothetical protein
MFTYQLIHQIYEKFRGLPVRLAERHNLSAEWFRSHGYPPKTLDAYGNGNSCPEIENYLQKTEEFESAAPGAGQMLNQLVYAEIKRRLCVNAEDCSQRELRRIGLKEATEAITALDSVDFQEASNNDLTLMNKELFDLIEWANKAQFKVHNEMEKRSIQQQNFGDLTTNGNGARR